MNTNPQPVIGRINGWGQRFSNWNRKLTVPFVAMFVLVGMYVVFHSFAASASASLFTPTAIPAHVTANDSSAVELGMKFKSDIAGTISAVRFYKGPNNTGVHTGTLWSASGIKLATATFTNETASGWQQVTFSAPVTIAANTIYVASYHTNTGNYSYDYNGFATQLDRGSLHALANGANGPNGVYAYGLASTFPTSGYQASNYWVDVVFTATPSPDTSPPTVSITAPVSNATVSGTVQLTGTATDNVGVTSVKIGIDNGTPMVATSTSAWNYALDTIALNEGVHTIHVTAYDAAGNTGTSSLSVNVKNAVATPPPLPTPTPAPTPTPTPPPTPSTNLALNRPTTASSAEATGLESAKAVDAKTSSRWSSAFSDPQWISVDLGATYTINRVKLNWETAYASAYKLQVSNDTTTWTDIYGTTTGSGGVTDLANLTATGRYVRMYGTKRATAWGYSLWEFEVYGSGATPTPTPPPPVPDTTLPSAPANLSAQAISSTQVVLNWTASTDNVGVKSYQVFRSGTLIAQPMGTTYTDTGLSPATAYSYSIKAIDAAGNLSGASNMETVTTQASSDTTAPTAPSHLAATVSGPTQVDLSWTAAADTVGVSRYIVLRNNVVIADTVTTTSYSDTTAVANTTDSYQVKAQDAAGNTSSGSNTVTVTMPNPADTTPPSVPGSLTATAMNASQVNLSWGASTDNVAIVGYNIYRNGTKIATSTTTSYGDGTVSASTTYSYAVSAYDGAGNSSVQTIAVSVKTPTATPPGTLAVHVSGNQLVDQTGAMMHLHGVNISQTETACVAEDHRPYGWVIGVQPNGSYDTASAAMFQAVSSWNANAVRIPLNEDCWLGLFSSATYGNNGINSSLIGTNYQNNIKSYVTAAHAAGLYVILDLHFNSPGNFIADNQQVMADADHALDFWTSVASSFKNDPAAIFDLYNEPHPADAISDGTDQWTCWLQGCNMGTVAANNITEPDGKVVNGWPSYTWRSAGMQGMINAVRATGATNPVLVNGVGWSGDDSGWLAHKPTDPLNQIIVGLHKYPYNPAGGGYPDSAAGVAQMQNDLTSVFPALAAQYPILMGETGDKTLAPVTQPFPALLQYAQNNGWSYMAWTFNTWGSSGPYVLISDWNGAPFSGEGTTYKNWLAAHPPGDKGGTTPPSSPPSGTAVFNDDFNGTAVDTSLWTMLNEHGDTSNSEAQCYVPGNTTETGGFLVETLKVQSISCPGPAGTTSAGYSSGAVQMKSFNFTYGTVEARIKFTGGTGPWPAFWMLGANCQTPQWLPDPSTCHWPNTGSDEIDIAEILGSGLTTVNQQIHSNGANPGCRPTISDVSQNWHTYTLVWQPGSVVWKIDGATTCIVTQNVPTTPMFVIVNTAIGGAGGGTISNGTLPQTTQVDYVKATK